jgi:hypothetical protein
MPMVIEPPEMALEMSSIALRPEEQKRFTEEAVVVLGKPAARAADRTLKAALLSET